VHAFGIEPADNGRDRTWCGIQNYGPKARLNPNEASE
jgi:hypothetical protein